MSSDRRIDHAQDSVHVEGTPAVGAGRDELREPGRRDGCRDAAAGGDSFYFGKPHPPIYALARARLGAHLGEEVDPADVLAIGDGVATDILGAMGENLEALFVTGGLAAEETATAPGVGPDPARLAAFLAAARLAPLLATGYLT